MARTVREICLKLAVMLLRLLGQRPGSGWQPSRRPVEMADP